MSLTRIWWRNASGGQPKDGWVSLYAGEWGESALFTAQARDIVEPRSFESWTFDGRQFVVRVSSNDVHAVMLATRSSSLWFENPEKRPGPWAARVTLDERGDHFVSVAPFAVAPGRGPR